MPEAECGCKAWIYNEEDPSSKHALHQHNPPRFVSHDELKAIGVLYFRMDGLDQDPKLAALREERGYTNFDVVEIKQGFPEEKLTEFFDEHLHEDEEIRLCLAGSGFFDLRNKNEEWIRVHCTPGDLLIVPAGIYHRFTLDENMYIKAMRLFTSAPKWIPLSRSLPDTDTVPSRIEYEKSLASTGPSSSSSSSDTSSQQLNGTPIIINDGPQSLANYPHARVFGDIVYLSGFSSRRADNTHRGAVKREDGGFDLDVYEQTIGVLDNMQAVLKKTHPDASLHDLIDITVFLTDMSHFKRYNEAYNLYFNQQNGPTRTTVAVKQLPHPNLLIEIKGIAALRK